MEEPHVPLLLDLQIFEPQYVFEPKTVQRMELWVMSILNWRLRAVTPFDFLHHFISDLPSSSAADDGGDGDGDDCHRLFSTSSDLILSTTRGTFYKKLNGLSYHILSVFVFFVLP